MRRRKKEWARSYSSIPASRIHFFMRLVATDDRTQIDQGGTEHTCMKEVHSTPWTVFDPASVFLSTH